MSFATKFAGSFGTCGLKVERKCLKFAVSFSERNSERFMLETSVLRRKIEKLRFPDFIFKSLSMENEMSLMRLVL